MFDSVFDNTLLRTFQFNENVPDNPTSGVGLDKLRLHPTPFRMITVIVFKLIIIIVLYFALNVLMHYCLFIYIVLCTFICDVRNEKIN